MGVLREAWRRAVDGGEFLAADNTAETKSQFHQRRICLQLVLTEEKQNESADRASGTIRLSSSAVISWPGVVYCGQNSLLMGEFCSVK